jgi:prophage regulatory protein
MLSAARRSALAGLAMQKLQRIIRLRELPDYVGLKRTQIDELIQRGEFPKPIPLSDTGRAKGWLESEILVWQAHRLAARDG